MNNANISKLIEQIMMLEDENLEENGYLLELRIKNNVQVEMSGNSSGYLYLARQIIELVNKNENNYHIHIDAASGFAEGSDSLVLNYEK